MKVLVTGATGLIGSHLIEVLIKEGYDIRSFAEKSRDTSWLENLGVEIVWGDIRDAETVEQSVKGCQQVYHLAGKVSQPGISPHEYYAVNVEGTQNVARACLKADIERLVYGSSTGVYGTIRHSPVDEKTPSHPDSPYRQSKWMAEQAVLSYYHDEGLPVVSARLTSVTGARAYDWSDLLQAISNGHFRAIGTGDNYYHTVDVFDVVQGLICCANTKNIEGECYLIAGEKPIQLKELLKLMAQELGVVGVGDGVPSAPFQAFSNLTHFVYRSFGIQIPYGNRYELFLTNKVLSITKAQKELGYSPKVSIAESIHNMVNWYCQQK